MRDSERQQILDACDGQRSTAELMRFLLAVRKLRQREYPNDAPDSPRLWIVMTNATLAGKTGYSLRQITRGLALLRRRGFIVPRNGKGEAGTYQVVPDAIEKWLQPMPLFEQEAPPDPSHDGQGTLDMVARVPTPPCPGGSSHHGQSLPYMRPYYPSSSPGDDDDANEDSAEQSRRAPVTVPAEPPHPGSDPEKERLIEAFQAIGIATEQTEAHLTRHTRQKLQAALECLNAKQRLGTRIPSPAGFVIHFLAQPGQYGYELDPHGLWRPSVLIHQARRQKALLAQARDSPPDNRDQVRAEQIAARAAWEALGEAEQEAIRRDVRAAYPHWCHNFQISPECQRLALHRTQAKEPCP